MWPLTSVLLPWAGFQFQLHSGWQPHDRGCLRNGEKVVLGKQASYKYGRCRRSVNSKGDQRAPGDRKCADEELRRGRSWDGGADPEVWEESESRCN